MQTYPIQTGPSAPSTTFLLASQLGLALNCDLATGLDKTTGAVPVDDGPAIEAALAGATVHNPLCLLMDGGSYVSGLRLPVGGHWSIWGYGRDTGFFIASGANSNGIQNGSALPIAANAAAPARGTNGNVSIRDITLNCNCNVTTPGNSSGGGDSRASGAGANQGYWLLGIYLVGLNGIEIRNVYLTHSPSFNIVFENCGDWNVDGCHIEGQSGNTDGVHINGPSDKGRIRGCYFACGDDPIALNAWEGYGGLITQISIDDCVSYSQTLGRMYTTSNAPPAGAAQALVDGVTFSNCQFTAWADNGLYLGLGSGSVGVVADTITNVTFLNCKFTSTAAVQISEAVGTLAFIGCDFIGTTDACLIAAGTAGNATVSKLDITNCRLLRNSAGTTSLLGALSNLTFKRVTITGLAVVDVYGYSGLPIAGLLSLGAGATITGLHISDLDASNITALIASGSSPAVVSGGGVLQTGWAIADSIMAKWTPYVSATSGVPSYRNGAGAVVAL